MDYLETYVFPEYEQGISAERARAKKKWLTKTINKYVKRIAGNVGIKEYLTSYWTMHLFAMALRNAGASDEFIGDSFWHTDTRITQNYLRSFVDEKKKPFAVKLTDFNNQN